MRAVQPLPIRLDWMPSYLAPRHQGNRDFAFRFADPEGAPSRHGGHFHGAVDWFAPGGTVIRAPAAGRISRFEPSADHSGPVFGGVLQIEQVDGLCWTMRHVDPKARIGTDVDAGEVVAEVMRWDDGPDHLHLEIWRTRGGGYVLENFIDPLSVDWGEEADEAFADPSPFYFEELPHDEGGAGPVVVWHGTSATGAAKATRIHRDRGRTVTTMTDDAGVIHVLWLAPPTTSGRFRFGGWAEAQARDLKRRARESNTGRRMRAFKGRATSLYPWPAAEVGGG